MLQRALVLTFVCHGLAMLGMAVFLLPALPGGGTADDAMRMATIAEHPWLFRIGWLPWHLTALSDVVLAWALVRTAWIPRWHAWLSLMLTLVAALADLGGQLAWVTRGVTLAQEGDRAAYLAFEAVVFPMVGWWAGLLYTLGAIVRSVAFARAGVWSRTLTVLSIATWGIFLAVSVGPMVHLPDAAAAAGNAAGFVLMLIWFVLVISRVIRRTRPDTAHGRYAPWRHPRTGRCARAIEIAANSRVLRAALEPLGVLAFRSDIREVVYVNYLVEASALESYVPPGLTLQRLGPKGQWALFTFLTYQHGAFGPTRLGRFRHLFPSPVQSNWRTYVKDDVTGASGVYFVTNAVTTHLHALGARLMAEGMPMHLLAHGEVARTSDGRVCVRLDPGGGTAPDCEADLRPHDDRRLPPPWNECFDDYRAMLAYAVPQDRAMSTQPWADRLTLQEIELGIPLEACEPLTGDVSSRAARRIVGDAVPLCFRVAEVSFHFAKEERLTLHQP